MPNSFNTVFGVLEAQGVEGAVTSAGGVVVRNCTSSFEMIFSGLRGASPAPLKPPRILFSLIVARCIRLDALFLAHRPFLAVQSSRHQEAGVDERHEQAYRCNYLLLLTISHKFGRVMAFMTIKNQETIGTN
ncbi:Uncharacterized protein HZ326_27464 [Fusarium oxysporum f. sp. albedinis]|nr:Uncharacterized protein HZ326_27464 [Fusarium oxysporum f. sp. albedinis]